MQKEKINIWIPSRRHLWQDECSLLQELWYKALKVLVFVKKKKTCLDQIQLVFTFTFTHAMKGNIDVISNIHNDQFAKLFHYPVKSVFVIIAHKLRQSRDQRRNTQRSANTFLFSEERAVDMAVMAPPRQCKSKDERGFLIWRSCRRHTSDKSAGQEGSDGG